MRTSLSPTGILLANTLPSVLLIALYAGAYHVIHPLLDEDASDLWKRMTLAMATLTAVSAAYAVVRLVQRRPVQLGYAVAAFLTYVPLIYVFYEVERELFPSGIPNWMLPQDVSLYAMRFLAPVLAHALFVLVMASLPEGSRGRPLRDILIAVAIPLGCYLFVQVVEPWRGDADFERHAWIVLMVVLVIAFLFFLCRGVGALIMRSSGGSLWGPLLRSLIALALPLIGLCVNNGVFSSLGQGAFGDLAHPAFYIIALVNGILVMLPSSSDPRLRFVQFVLRAIGFSYVLYFFILFLPLLPVSLIAIVGLGVGFLLLAPVLLFIVQSMQLAADLKFLSAHRSCLSLLAVFALCLFVLPAAITVRYLNDRRALHDALGHVYHPDLTATEVARVDTSALGDVLQRVEANKTGRWGPWRDTNTPFLTPYYNWLVLDNLTVSEEKLGTLRQVFIDDLPREAGRPWNVPIAGAVELDTIRSRPVFDADQQAWRTWVDLELSNTTDGQREYAKTFHLPPGAWISDEYLMIEGEEVHGILAERKSATWIYQQIVEVRRDPSLTRYIGPDRIELRVFPFAAWEHRRAGFEVLHKEPLTLMIDGRSIALGQGPALVTAVTSTDSSVTYVPAQVKAALPLIGRKMSAHFVVDGSESARPQREEFVRRIERFARVRPEIMDGAGITIADAYPVTAEMGEGWQQRLLQHAGDGGFFADRAIRRIIVQQCAAPVERVPMIVLVGEVRDDGAEEPGIFLDGLADLSSCMPEGAVFHRLAYDGPLTTYRMDAPMSTIVDSTSLRVRAWPDATKPVAYLADDGHASIVFNDLSAESDATVKERNWNDALALHGRWMRHQIHPEGGDRAWRDLVRGSFQGQVLTPVTAWLCLENEAQRNALMKKQQEVLNAESALDAGEEQLTSMSEPGPVWTLPLVLLLIWYLRRRGS